MCIVIFLLALAQDCCCFFLLFRVEYFFSEQNKFEAFSLEHLAVLLGYIFISILIFYWAKNYASSKMQNQVGFILSIIPLIAVLSRMYVQYHTGEFTYLEHLPLFVCRLVSFILPVLFITKNKPLFGVLYFWIIAGTTNALITPDIVYGLPHVESIFYWAIHSGLVMGILYGVFVFGWRPQRRDIWRAFLYANGYLIFIHLFNVIVGSNYSYTMHKPVNGSILDFFGPWPWYLATGQALALALFLIFYIPFYFLEEPYD